MYRSLLHTIKSNRIQLQSAGTIHYSTKLYCSSTANHTLANKIHTMPTVNAPQQTSDSTSSGHITSHATNGTIQPDQNVVTQNREVLLGKQSSQQQQRSMSTAASRHSAIDDMLSSNAVYANGIAPTAQAKLPMQPGKKLCVVMCMDSRIDAFKCFGLQHGDAHVIRNAGGRISEALRSVIVSQALLGTEEIAIIHHTECGILRFNDEQVKAAVIEQREKNPNMVPYSIDTVKSEVERIKFLSFQGTPQQSVVVDLREYRASPLVKHTIPVRGFVFDVHTGRLTEVVDNEQK